MNQADIDEIVRELTDRLHSNGFLSREEAFEYVLRNYGMEYTSPEKGLSEEVAEQFKAFRGPGTEWSVGWQGWVVK